MFEYAYFGDINIYFFGMAIWETCNVQKCPTNFRDMQNHATFTVILLLLGTLTAFLH
jgi:hypothetical protein